MKQLYTSKNEGTAPRIFTLALCKGELSNKMCGLRQTQLCSVGFGLCLIVQDRWKSDEEELVLCFVKMCKT
jgi:hypothetical protein